MLQEHHIQDIVIAWPEDLKDILKILTPGAINLFDKGDSEALDDDKRDIFHLVVAKGLFVGNRSRPDTLITISVLSLRVKAPNKDNLLKARRLVRFLKNT